MLVRTIKIQGGAAGLCIRAVVATLMATFATVSAADAPQPTAGAWELNDGDVVAFVGGTITVLSRKHGYLETLLTVACADKHVRFRNLAWEADTVFRQWRPEKFGDWDRQLVKSRSTVVFVQLGQSEVLQTGADVREFSAAYRRLLDQLQERSKRVVLLTPTQFESITPWGPHLAERNAALRVYVDEIRKIAGERDVPLVDLFTALMGPDAVTETGRNVRRLTNNGFHLNRDGYWWVAREVARQLGIEEDVSEIQCDPTTGRLQPAPVEQLRQEIIAKNQLWFNYWRPMNWAFLHGYLTNRASSRDHIDRNIRWFPKEMEQFLPLIYEQEQQIRSLAAEMTAAGQ